jgi:hypothetical protein
VINVDTSIAQPTIASIVDNAAGGVEGDIPRDGTGLTNDNRPVISGSAEAGSLVKIYDSGNVIGSVYADRTTGAWTWQYAAGSQFADGNHNLTVVATDPAGNSSSSSLSFVINVDTAIAPPIISSLYENNGEVENGGTTSDQSPQLFGTAEAGGMVSIYNDDIFIGSAIVNANGDWDWIAEVNGGPLPYGRYNFTVTVTDKAGNVSDKSNDWSLSIEKGFASGFEGWDGYSFSPEVGVEYVSPSNNGLKYELLKIGNHRTFFSGDLTLADEATLQITLPETKSISFDVFASNGPGAYAEMYNSAGSVVGKVEFTISTPTIRYFFTAPEGEAIGKVIFHNGVDNKTEGLIIDNIGWGDQSGVSANSTYTEEVINVSHEQYEFCGINDFQVSSSHIELSESLEFNNIFVIKSPSDMDTFEHRDNVLNLSLDDIINHGEKDIFIEDNKTQFMVKGNEGDVVNLDDLIKDGDVSDWRAAGEVTVGGTAYQVYQHGDVEAELLVQQGVQVNLI